MEYVHLLRERDMQGNVVVRKPEDAAEVEHVKTWWDVCAPGDAVKEGVL